MNFRQHHFILKTVRALQEESSWTGKTHVQKSLYLLKACSSIDVPFDFVLYMHGPYSFEVEEELAQMRSYTAILVQPAQEYGVTISPGPMATYVEKQVALEERETREIERVCRFVGTRGVVELEKLATAAWIRVNESKTDAEGVARRLHELKPHIPVADARLAYEQVTQLFDGLRS